MTRPWGPRILTYQGLSFEELDIEAPIDRHPERAPIDELAHTNVPGSRRAKRWEDDLVARITGIRQQEVVPDWVLEPADQRRWSKQGTPETRDRILVCVSRPGVSEQLIRRGSRIAHRTQGDLIVVHVATSERRPDPQWVGQVRLLVQDLGGEFHVLDAEEPVEEVLSFAYQQHVTQILVGESLRPRWQELRGSVGMIAPMVAL